MNLQEVMNCLLQEATIGGNYHVVKQRVLDKLLDGEKLTGTNLLDKIQLMNEAQLLLHTQGLLSVEQTYGGQIVFVVYEASQATGNTHE